MYVCEISVTKAEVLETESNKSPSEESGYAGESDNMIIWRSFTCKETFTW